MKAILFPGQGAQRVGMGAGLFDAFPDLTRQADDILGYSISDLCLKGAAEKLTQTRYTQPALYVAGALGYLARRDQLATPDYLLGHSVAEYVALFAADVFDFGTGLRLVQARGELMGAAVGGGMAAVLGLDAAQVESVLLNHAAGQVYAANYNTPRQIVISGKRDVVARLEPAFREAGATYFKVLDVSGAFHTPFMAPARDAFRSLADAVTFAPPRIPVISNVTARPHQPDRLRERMIEQITAPVRWSDSLRYLLAKGIATPDVEEIAPKGVSVVKPMLMRTQIECGPLDASEFSHDLQSETVAEPAATQVDHRSACRHTPGFTLERLGSRTFCREFGVRTAYLSGGMYQGVSSVDVVVRMAKAGLMGFFGAGGLRPAAIETAILAIQSQIPNGAPYGINFIAHANAPQVEDDLADLLMKHGVTTIEASAFMQVTPALVRYRAKGLERDGNCIRSRHRIIAKISRPDVAKQFLSPAPEPILAKLIESGALTPEEADLARAAPVADAICVEADSGGHTDQRMPLTLLPAILAVRDRCAEITPRFGRVHVGAAGGIGTPEAAAAMFVMGADFILTGSINQCTVEAGTSDVVKDLLQSMNVHDTDYAPSGDLFEMGSKVQVLKKGIFFPARANKLVALYRQHESLDDIDDKTRALIEERYLKRTFAQVFDETAAAYPGPDVERARRSPKHRMALVFRRYFRDSTRWALAGDLAHKVDFQVQCGPAQGAFNQWVGGNGLASWRDRHVDGIAERLMDETASLLNRRFAAMQAGADFS
ncbi:ACP S-malonyltransferase [Hyphomicrobium sp.]|uniref:ACP S-malonyltransferase n=1 Tax=Hyphomicrobium sp. TaxID=82 RepID=UPI002E2FB15E|nr:ACP S-malonyltransferase [Hyphomicrobium sp.]HEX2841888.1 ACP S-malonyltransferase [Hyphomicrobium sp.]